MSLILLLTAMLFIMGGCKMCDLTGSCPPDKDASKEAELQAEIDRLNALRDAAINGVPTVPPPTPVNRPPGIIILRPDDGENITGENFLIRWEAADPDNDELRINLELKRERSVDFVFIDEDLPNTPPNYVWDLEGITDGEFTLRATVTDGELTGRDTTEVFFIDND